MTDLGWSIDLTQQAAGNQPAAIDVQRFDLKPKTAKPNLSTLNISN
jgi:hypothetical protein